MRGIYTGIATLWLFLTIAFGCFGLVLLSELTDFGLLVAIGCQGRGIAWQTAMGAELAHLVVDSAYDPVLPFSPVRSIPFHSLKALGVASTIAAYRALDRLGFG